MAFAKDNALATEVGDTYGTYVTTFISETGQVRADLFEDAGQLVAHVSFSTGIDFDQVTDKYLSKLDEFAKERGFEGRLRILYAE